MVLLQGRSIIWHQYAKSSQVTKSVQSHQVSIFQILETSTICSHALCTFNCICYSSVFPNVEQKMKLKQMITDDTDELKTFRYKNVYKSNV